MTPLSLRVAARFKEKKVNPNGGRPIYLYSERQVAIRNRKKAERLEKLSKNIHSLRERYRKDLDSDDPKTRLTALCVGLIDVTAERIGSTASASGKTNEDEEPHFGVSTFKREHISMGKGKATISYTGKSGVKQKKEVTDKRILSALKRSLDDCTDDGIFCHKDVKVGASEVNQYLKEFDVTAKDLRGFHSNLAMKQALKRIRSKGGKLPEDKKEREAKLKAEFKEALEEVAEQVGGHEPSTLKNQYLVPAIEETYLKDGTVTDSMKTAATRVALRYKGV